MAFLEFCKLCVQVVLRHCCGLGRRLAGNNDDLAVLVDLDAPDLA
jgi:hypothetical protein